MRMVQWRMASVILQSSLVLFFLQIYPGVPKKAEWQIFSTLRAKSVIIVYIIISSTEENDTKIIEFG